MSPAARRRTQCQPTSSRKKKDSEERCRLGLNPSSSSSTTASADAVPCPPLGRRATLSFSATTLAVALCVAVAAPSPSTAFENDRDMLDDHTPESAFIFATIRAHKVVIFSKSYCPYCRAVKKIFAEEYPEEKPYVVELDGREDMTRIQDTLQHLYG